MKKFPKPWYRPARGVWYVTLDGHQHNLGPDKDEAFRRYKKLLAEPKLRPVRSDSLAAIADVFLEWVQHHRSPDTYEWYRYGLERFVKRHPDLRAADVRPFHAHLQAAGTTHRDACRPAAEQRFGLSIDVVREPAHQEVDDLRCRLVGRLNVCPAVPVVDRGLVGQPLNPKLRNATVAILPVRVLGMLGEHQGVEAVTGNRSANPSPAARCVADRPDDLEVVAYVQFFIVAGHHSFSDLGLDRHRTMTQEPCGRRNIKRSWPQFQKLF